MVNGCVFCDGEGGLPVWRDERCRVVVTDEPFAGFCRVIWNAHVREMTDLGSADRDHLMRAVYAVESALRARLSPTKMNIAALGNVVPQLHIHHIARHRDDASWPAPVWGKVPARAYAANDLERTAEALRAALEGSQFRRLR